MSILMKRMVIKDVNDDDKKDDYVDFNEENSDERC